MVFGIILVVVVLATALIAIVIVVVITAAVVIDGGVILARRAILAQDLLGLISGALKQAGVVEAIRIGLLELVYLEIKILNICSVHAPRVGIVIAALEDFVDLIDQFGGLSLALRRAVVDKIERLHLLYGPALVILEQLVLDLPVEIVGSAAVLVASVVKATQV